MEGAREHYTASLRHETRNHLVWANRSAAHLRLERHQDALDDARKARVLEPGYAKAWFREGAAWEALERWEVRSWLWGGVVAWRGPVWGDEEHTAHAALG